MENNVTINLAKLTDATLAAIVADLMDEGGCEEMVQVVMTELMTNVGTFKAYRMVGGMRS